MLTIGSRFKWLILIAALLAAGCTRSASTAVPDFNATNSAAGFVSPEQATMDAVRDSLLTQEARQTQQSVNLPPVTATATPIVNTPQPTNPPPTATPAVEAFEYTVQQGEWIYSIASKFKVDPDKLIALNNLPAPYAVNPGDVLLIPGTSSATALPAGTPVPGNRIHTVKAGEWVYSIARIYGVAPDAIIAANGLIAPYTVYPGDQLIIP